MGKGLGHRRARVGQRLALGQSAIIGARVLGELESDRRVGTVLQIDHWWKSAV